MRCFIIKTGYAAAIFLLFALNTFAQDAYYHDNAPSARGYWRLFTDYTARNTIVKFYNAGN